MAEYSGVVKSFGWAKGYGFIQSDDTPGDIFFSKTVLPPDVVSAVEGRCFDLTSREVIFTAEVKEGKTQAQSVQLVPREGLPLVGKVKSYSPSAGYGFIGADLIGQDVFFMKTELPSGQQDFCAKGTAVSFCIVQTQEGKIQAQGLRVANGDRRPDARQGGAPNFAGMDPRELGLAIMNGTIPMASLGMPGMFGGKTPSTGESMSGTVRTYSQKHGWGFITSPGCATDIYFKCSDGSISEGMQVEFTATTMPDGKVQARNVTAGLEDGSNVVGTVKSYNPQKGFGFLRVPGSPSDVHFQKMSLPLNMQDSEQLEGQTFHFSLRLHSGKMQARDMRYSGSSGDYVAASAGFAQKRAAPHGGFAQLAKKQKISPSFTPPGGAPSSVGVVKSYGVQKGWGFISCAGVDVYFKGSSLPAVHQQRGDLVGSNVSFEINRTPDGKLQAQPGIVIL